MRRFQTNTIWNSIPEASPAFVDWYGDGNVHLAVGDADGRVRFLIDCDEQGRCNSPDSGSALDVAMVNVSTNGDAAAPAFVDWDGDQDLDVVVGTKSGQLEYWERLNPEHLEQQVGDANPFKDVATSLDASPAFADWDEDGDPDLILGGRDGQLRYFENVEGVLKRRTGQDNPFFDIFFREGSTAPSFVDWDGDKDLDLVVGGENRLTFYERVAPGWLSEKTAVVDEEGTIFSKVAGRVKPAFLIQNGTWQAFLMSTYAIDSYTRYFSRLSVMPHRLDLVERTGVNNILNSVDTTERHEGFQGWNVSNLPLPIDMSQRTVSPAILPWGEADHLEVLLGDASDTLRFFQQIRIGVVKELRGLENPFSEFIVGPNPRPSVCDWYGNGSRHIFVGLESGEVHLFEKMGPGRGNQGLPNRGDVVARTSQNATLRDDPFKDISVRHAAPACADIDGDQEMDLVVGGEDGKLEYWKRSGETLIEPEYFENPFRHIDVGEDAMPTFLDLDGDGDLDLVVGNAEGCTKAFVLFRSSYSLTYTADAASLPWEGFCPGAEGAPQAAPVAVDLDRDGDLDLVLGTVGRDLRYFSQAFCNQLEACDSRGNCDGITGTCACAQGHALPSCTSCQPSYFTLPKDHTGDHPTCLHCQKSNDKICGMRGICLDDLSAAVNTSLSNTSLLIARGSGECMCSHEHFQGPACDVGSCPRGTEEIVDDRTMVTNCVPCPAGEYSDEGMACKTCAEGIPTKEQDACQECKSGRFGFPGEASCRINSAFWALAVWCFTIEMMATFAVLRVVGRRVTIADISDQGDRLVVQTDRPHGVKFLVSRSAKVCLDKTGCFDLDGRRLNAKVLDSMRLEVEAPASKPTKAGHAEASMGTVTFRFLGNIQHTRFGSIRTVVWLFVFIPLPYFVIYLYRYKAFLQPEGWAPDGTREHPDTSIDEHLDVLESLWPYTLGGGFLGFFLAIISHLVRLWKRTPIEIKLRQFQSKLWIANPNPKRTERGPRRAVTLQQILDLEDDFKSYVQNRTAYYLVPNIILRLTKRTTLSYSELVSKEPQCLVYFVSHYWGTPFAHFVLALRRHAEHTGREDWRSLAYWVCFLSNNQWQIPQEVGEGDWKESSFYKALRSGHCAATCMVLDDQALPLTRSWCLFEVLQTYSLQRAGMAFEGLRFCTAGGVLGSPECTSYDSVMALGSKLAHLDLAEASATNREDEEMIKNLVDAEGGIQQMNKFIRTKMMDALREAQQNFINKTAQLNRELAHLPQHHQENAYQIMMRDGFLRMMQSMVTGDALARVDPGQAPHHPGARRVSEHSKAEENHSEGSSVTNTILNFPRPMAMLSAFHNRSSQGSELSNNSPEAHHGRHSAAELPHRSI